MVSSALRAGERAYVFVPHPQRERLLRRLGRMRAECSASERGFMAAILDRLNDEGTCWEGVRELLANVGRRRLDRSPEQRRDRYVKKTGDRAAMAWRKRGCLTWDVVRPGEKYPSGRKATKPGRIWHVNLDALFAFLGGEEQRVRARKRHLKLVPKPAPEAAQAPQQATPATSADAPKGRENADTCVPGHEDIRVPHLDLVSPPGRLVRVSLEGDSRASPAATTAPPSAANVASETPGPRARGEPEAPAHRSSVVHVDFTGRRRAELASATPPQGPAERAPKEGEHESGHESPHRATAEELARIFAALDTPREREPT